MMSHKFYIVDNWALPGKMLVGSDFLDAHRVILDSSSPFLVINGQKVRLIRRRSTSVKVAATTVSGGRSTHSGSRDGSRQAGTPAKFTAGQAGDDVTATDQGRRRGDQLKSRKNEQSKVGRPENKMAGKKGTISQKGDCSYEVSKRQVSPPTG